MENLHKTRRRLIRSGVQSSLDSLLTQETLVQQELVRGYKGMNGAKGHKAIARSQVHPDYRVQNLKQQSGFNAEINLVTQTNIKAIRNKSDVRSYRTDELGQVNNPTADIVWIDEKTGERIPNSSIQVKFRGKTGADNVKQFLTKKEFDKYQNQWLAIPSEQLHEANQHLNKKIDSYTLQIDRLKKRGELEKAQQVLEKRKRAQSVKDRLIDGGKQNEAMKYRLKPLQEHLKNSIKEAHVAGKQAALRGAAVSGVMTAPFIARRLHADEAYTWKEAGGDFTKVVASSALTSYIVSGTTVLIQGQLITLESVLLKQVAKTNLIGHVATVSIDLTKNFHRLTKDPEYQFLDFLADTSEQLVGTLSAAFLTTAVKTVLPASVNPAFLAIPGMIGYAAGQYIVKELIALNKDAQLAREKRLEVEAFCIEMDRQLDTLGEELEAICLKDALHWKEIHTLMNQIKSAETTDSLNRSIIQMAERFEIELRLTQFEEFDDMMSDSTIPFKL